MKNTELILKKNNTDNVYVVQVKNFAKKMSVLGPQLTPRDKIKIPKPHCTSTSHSQSYPRVSFVYSMKCRQSSSDNSFH